ncbi:tetraacyldisaccharide 4'-kinase [Pelagibacterales bacterium SAG-MED43]|nr:tetraacyldisaccharide 4'-kinase [Pelagibacterales bacterium SAG-MED43]
MKFLLDSLTKLNKPKFWDLDKPNLISYILIPFSLPILLRNFLFKFFKKKKSSRIKTICVGNIYLGGTGKTPLTIRIYEILKNLKYKAATVKKNYSNQKDEQLLLNQKTNLIIVKSRKNAIHKGLKQNLDFLIFDDGLQEIGMGFDLKLVCFKSKYWIGNGQLIPSGPMREKVSSLKRFDAVFLNGYSNNLEKIEKQIQIINSNIKIFRTFYKILNIDKYDLDLKYLIFSGIGNPSEFKEILLENKFNIEKEIIFTDHYNYNHSDFEKIIENAKNDNLNIITTEKDYMKIPPKFREEIKFLSIDVIIQNENELINLLKR